MRKFIALASTLLLLPAFAFEVPVADLGAWTSLSYQNIKPNEVSVRNGALLVSVRNSASPLVYRFDAPMQIAGITVVAEYSGGLRIPDDAVQGEGDADDFVLKVGIVERGDRTLNWLQRRIAADWVKKLHALAPAGSGIKRINFLSTTQSRAQLGSERLHPLSDLLHEKRIEYLDEPGTFRMSHEFPQPVEALGLWLSSDGDDTGSSFDVRVERITLHTN